MLQTKVVRFLWSAICDCRPYTGNVAVRLLFGLLSPVQQKTFIYICLADDQRRLFVLDGA